MAFLMIFVQPITTFETIPEDAGIILAIPSNKNKGVVEMINPIFPDIKNEANVLFDQSTDLPGGCNFTDSVPNIDASAENGPFAVPNETLSSSLRRSTRSHCLPKHLERISLQFIDATIFYIKDFFALFLWEICLL